MHARTRLGLLALVCAALAWPAADAAAARKQKRFGIEGEIVSYDEARKVVRVRVMSTNVPGRSLSGNTVGGKAPNDIKRLKEYEFAVEPEGSVLRRTVIKAMTGGGLDNSGTKEGFQKALSQIPEDRPVVMSCMANDAKAVENGGPAYKILLVQIQLSMEELIERWEAITEEVD